MKVPILLHVRDTEALIESGFIETETFDAQHFWHLCNWFFWADEKPENLHSDIDNIDHGIVFINPETNEWHLALSNGWLAGDEPTIRTYIHNNYKKTTWFTPETKI